MGDMKEEVIAIRRKYGTESSGVLQVLFTTRASLGVATLNRPKALNSLNLNMIHLLTQQYQAWSKDDDVKAVLLKSSTPKAFCAGGDVKTSVLQIRDGRKADAKQYFRDEYIFDYMVATFNKPLIAIIDGIVMGGGAGISIHGTFRVATERTTFAMPEVGIGLFPDVGSMHFLSRLQGHLGTYLAVTGARLKGHEVVEAGIATHLVSSEKLPELEQQIIALGPSANDALQLERLLSSFQAQSSQHTEPTGLLQNLPSIESAFSYNSMESITAAVESSSEEWATEAAQLLQKSSKLSQKVSLEAVRRAACLSLADCLKMDLRLVNHMVDQDSDFTEGIRALLIDKDGNPQWNPQKPEQVSQERVLSFFDPLPAGEELQLVPIASKL